MSQDHPPEVLLIRGGAGYWPGVSRLANELSDHGFAPKIVMGAFSTVQAPRIAADYYSGGRCTPVTIVGYSSGADYACKLCQGLEARGVPVATLVLIESTLGTEVPGNVELCINMYESRPATDWIPAFRGIAVRAASPQTSLVNLDANKTPDLQWLKEYNHFTVASNSESRVMIRNLLLLRQNQFTEQQARSTGLPVPLSSTRNTSSLPPLEPVPVRKPLTSQVSLHR